MAVLRSAALALALSTSCLAAPVAFALENHLLENVRIPAKDSKGDVLIRRIEITGTNLTRPEIDAFLSSSTSPLARSALAMKMEAARISIPEIVVTQTGEQTGALTFRDYVMVNVNRAKFESADLSGFSGVFKNAETGKDASEGRIASGPLSLKNVDVSSVVAAALKGDATDGAARVGAFSWTGLQLTVPDVETPATAVGGNLYDIRLAGATGGATYDGDAPLAARMRVEGLSFTPPRASAAGQALASFGYEKVDLGMNVEGAYDPVGKAFKLVDYSVSGADAGVLGLSGAFGNIDRSSFTGDKAARMNALMQGDLRTLTLKYVDNGLFQKALAFYAAMQQKDVAAVRLEWAMMVSGMLPILLGGEPSALLLADALGTFVKDPRSLTISLKSKGFGASFLGLAQIKDPADFFSKIDLSVTANR
ncbi:MAG: hypothetical protein JWN93_3886 [Hyphomicrobiales bacterium]|nr:hypothetical protein [Hyphomicrobiales bacterium]